MRIYTQMAGFALALIPFAAACSLSKAKTPSATLTTQPKEVLLVAGSYSPAGKEGIRLYSFNEERGDIKLVSTFAGVANPLYVAPSADGKHLFAVSESDSPSDALYTLALDEATKRISLIDSIHVGGAAPCHVELSRDSKHLFTANYNGGSLTALTLGRSGELLREGKQVQAFAGRGHHPERQTASHAHFVATPEKNAIWVSDLGLDSIHIFTIQGNKASGNALTLKAKEGIKLPKGYGPRHIAFTPNGRYAYIMTELAGKIVGLRQEGKQWRMFTETLADSLQSGGSADIHISPDGLFVYSSHRLRNDGIAIHRITKGGTLEYIGYQKTGKHPRNFALSPNGIYLLVACRDSDSIEVYQRDAETGLLRMVGTPTAFPRVSSLRFVAK